jgi:hypothetical protein
MTGLVEVRGLTPDFRGSRTARVPDLGKRSETVSDQAMLTTLDSLLAG